MSHVLKKTCSKCVDKFIEKENMHNIMHNKPYRSVNYFLNMEIDFGTVRFGKLYHTVP